MKAVYTESCNSIEMIIGRVANDGVSSLDEVKVNIVVAISSNALEIESGVCAVSESCAVEVVIDIDVESSLASSACNSTLINSIS